MVERVPPLREGLWVVLNFLNDKFNSKMYLVMGQDMNDVRKMISFSKAMARGPFDIMQKMITPSSILAKAAK